MTIFALGASAAEIQKAFNDNANYQRPQFPVDKEDIQAMSDPAIFKKYLNNEKYFHDFEIFFRKEIERHNGSWQAVLNEHIFADTPQARDMFVRMFAGFYHPIIHLGFGIEFEQPAVMVEALAQAATHDRWPGDFVEQTTERTNKRVAAGEKARPLLDLIMEARSNEKVRESVHWEDGNKVRDGLLKRALPEAIDLCSQWFVTPDSKDLKLKTAEVANVCAFFSGASQHSSRKKQVKFDFFHMHSMNCSIFYSAFIDSKHDDWLKNEDRQRLLQFKGWSDIAMYISRGSAELITDEIKEYKPKRPNDGWAEIFKRVDAMTDDGHASKLVRAFANGERICAEYENNEGRDWPVKGDMWLKLGHMAIDSTEGSSSKWARNVGFDQAWKDVPDRTEDPNASGTRTEELKASPSLNGIASSYHEHDARL